MHGKYCSPSQPNLNNKLSMSKNNTAVEQKQQYSNYNHSKAAAGRTYRSKHSKNRQINIVLESIKEDDVAVNEENLETVTQQSTVQHHCPNEQNGGTPQSRNWDKHSYGRTYSEFSPPHEHEPANPNAPRPEPAITFQPTHSMNFGPSFAIGPAPRFWGVNRNNRWSMADPSVIYSMPEQKMNVVESELNSPDFNKLSPIPNDYTPYQRSLDPCHNIQNSAHNWPTHSPNFQRSGGRPVTITSINIDPPFSVKDDFSDMPLDNMENLRFFYNLGVEYFKLGLLVCPTLPLPAQGTPSRNITGGTEVLSFEGPKRQYKPHPRFSRRDNQKTEPRTSNPWENNHSEPNGPKCKFEVAPAFSNLNIYDANGNDGTTQVQ